jgi:hypothetical protein
MFIPIIELITTGRFKTRKYAAYVVTKAAKVGTSEQVSRLISHGSIRPLCDLLSARDLHVVDTVLTAVAMILLHGRSFDEDDGIEASDNKYASLIEEAGGEI